MGNVRWCEPEAICTDPDPARREFRKWVMKLDRPLKPRKKIIPPGHAMRAVTPGPGVVTWTGITRRHMYPPSPSKPNGNSMLMYLVRCGCGREWEVKRSQWVDAARPEACHACLHVYARRGGVQSDVRAA